MSVICTRCGGKDIGCEAIINPNGHVFKRYTDESFLYGVCNNCDNSAVLTDSEDVKRDMECLYAEFKAHSVSEPDYADCAVVFNEDGMQIDVKISMKPFVIDDDTDNGIEEKIFFYCAGLSDLKSLTEYGAEDFIITECYRFNHWTEKETMLQKKYSVELENTTVTVTGKEIRDFYGESYPLDKDFVEKFAAKTVAYRKWLRDRPVELMTPDLMAKLIESGCESDMPVIFQLRLHFLWYVEIRRETDESILPFKYALRACCLDGPQCFDRRYVAFDKALLHCVNNFNENASINNRYKSISDYISKIKRL